MNIVEILNGNNSGLILYSPLFGEVTFVGVKVNTNQIVVSDKNNNNRTFSEFGLYYDDFEEGECMLFPSRDQRDWSKFEAPKFNNPNSIIQKPEFKPFDRVLVRDEDVETWMCNFFSHLDKDGDPVCSNGHWHQCIPYEGNEHLLGTNNDPKQ